ncbi:MAG: hypothetical protein P4L87_18160, partial [Formivibrio sp.]|nr:hypothetical protein [Formivibrio sp.]
MYNNLVDGGAWGSSGSIVTHECLRKYHRPVVGTLKSGILDTRPSLASLAGPSGDQVLTVYHRVSQGVIDGIGGAHPVP